MSNQNESYPTLAIGLWISNEEYLSLRKDGLVEEAEDVDELAYKLKEWIVDEDYPLATAGMYEDLLGWALQQVNWHDLAETYWEDKETDDDEDDKEHCFRCGDSKREDDSLAYRFEYDVDLCKTCYHIKNFERDEGRV